MQPWADERPWNGRRLAAANYVLDSGGSPLPVGWYWAAKLLDFVPPTALIRSISRAAPVFIPTVAEAEKLQETHETDTNTPAAPKDTQAIIAGESPLHLDSLIPLGEARVRKEKHTHGPVSSSPMGAPEASSSSGVAQLHR